uniref:(northern house mosquito) hypothetical protein n=1 Tax=Culex pipiens TaxID=7175 RepID=A0A8D8J8G7_CULPI
MIPFDRQPLRRRPPPRGDVFSPPSPTALLPLPTTTAPAVCPDPGRVEVLAVSCDSRPHFDRHLVVPADRTQTMRFRLRSSWAVRVRTKKGPNQSSVNGTSKTRSFRLQLTLFGAFYRPDDDVCVCVIGTQSIRTGVGCGGLVFAPNVCVWAQSFFPPEGARQQHDLTAGRPLFTGQNTRARGQRESPSGTSSTARPFFTLASTE